ncbi:MAG: Archaeal seryl-tRNA synthetase-related sequence [Anaerolineae bacterium]|nr:MAG: Archaeal seryl-tRNA synthetase-related sequence [Anaerolineae bacterium]
MNATSLQITPQLLIPPHLVGEVQSKLAYVDERIAHAQISAEGNQITLELAHPIAEDEQAAIAAKVQRVVVSMTQGAIRPKVQILEDYLDRPTPYEADPMLELMRRAEIYPEASGIYTLGPLVTRLMEWFERQFLDLAASFSAQPYRFPTLIPARFLERVGYFRAFPHSLSFATHLREDLDQIDAFAESAACDQHGNLSVPFERFAPIQTLLSPAVCYHLYFTLADQTLPPEGVTATAVGNCFRYESLNLHSLERLWNFTMREVIFVGQKDFVLENREVARRRMQGVFEQIGFAYRVESANDPFFIGEFRKQAAFQSAFQLKYEIRARLPFKNSTLAVGSYNYHQDFFGRHLNIRLPDGSPAHTGCVAFGLERIAFAFLAQFGFDHTRWPQSMQEILQ